ncbi:MULTISPECIES: hypothetical protein [unclassified Methanoregula]|uniref:hypothetical protein n=1 Tax=unclassified Methanoregula TaxID=2649730 RepID=UPI0025F998C3|nr:MULTISPECIES: hypothetical protein [unclassified Methanoregula]
MIQDISRSRKQITLLIAHRLSTIIYTDVIYIMERGRIIETGSHADLLKQKGLYYPMWRQQIREHQSERGVQGAAPE